jgi:hypothetical protein
MWGRKRQRELPLPGREPEDAPLALREWSQALDVSRVTPHTVREAEYYLRHYSRMWPTTRHEASFRMMAILAVQVSPPPPLSIAPLDAVGTVLRAVRERGGA